jgi:dTDP-4-amino-4,6-dideoxygalactose transaminase
MHDEKEEEALVRVARSGVWQQGKEVAEFEEMFASYQGAKYGICAMNGTVTMELALRAFGVGPGDEVIIPPLTFIATGLAVLEVNAVPIFADVDPDNHNLSPQAVEEAVTERTRAIIPVHVGGVPADMDGLSEVASRHGLKIVEDAAHAHGAEWKGTRVGAIGDMGSFSFQTGKNMTSGDGGILLTNFEELAEQVKGLRTFGYGYPEPMMAHNYRMTEFQAAVLKVQFGRLDEHIAQNNDRAEYLSARLTEIEGITPEMLDPRVTRCPRYIYKAKYDANYFGGLDKHTFLKAVAAEGAPLSDSYGPLYRSPLFTGKAFRPGGCPVSCSRYGKPMDYTQVHCPVSEKVYQEEGICVFFTAFLVEKEALDAIPEAILKVQQHVGDLL